MTMGPTVFIVDDDAAFLESLTLLLQSVGLKCKGYLSAAEFLRTLDPSLPGCVILDVCMPSMGGLGLQDKLTKQVDCPPILFLTGHADVQTALRAMRQGAVEFLQKTCREAELLEAVHRAIAQDSQNRAVRERSATIRARLSQLTASEREVFDLVVLGKANKNIASILGISQRAVEDRRAKIMRKLGVDNVPALVRFAVEAGLESGV